MPESHAGESEFSVSRGTTNVNTRDSERKTWIDAGDNERRSRPAGNFFRDRFHTFVLYLAAALFTPKLSLFCSLRIGLISFSHWKCFSVQTTAAEQLNGTVSRKREGNDYEIYVTEDL